jgi:hypothetical protein
MAVEPGINERGEEGRLGGGGSQIWRREGSMVYGRMMGESEKEVFLDTSSYVQSSGKRTEKDEGERAASQRYVVDKGGFRISLWNFPESAPSPQDDEQDLEDQRVHLSSQWHACHPFH